MKTFRKYSFLLLALCVIKSFGAMVDNVEQVGVRDQTEIWVRFITDEEQHARSNRSKRVSNENIIYNTWCGKDWKVNKSIGVAESSLIENCCRTHKMCRHWIGSLQLKWGLFNWNENVLVQCKCEKKFRTCLKNAKNKEANLVGSLYFNVRQTQCFVTRQERTSCIMKSWWDRCLKYNTEKKAYLKDNKKY